MSAEGTLKCGQSCTHYGARGRDEAVFSLCAHAHVLASIEALLGTTLSFR